MRIAFLSDPHLTSIKPKNRKDDVLKTSKEKLGQVLLQCKNYRVENLLIAGDLFDRERDWNMLDGTLEIISKYWGVKIHAVSGQHDLYQYNKDAPSAYKVLSKIGLINDISGRHIFLSKTISVFGVGINDDLNEAKKIAKKNSEKFNILLIHDQIVSEEYTEGRFKDAKTFLNENKEFNLILCGDIHRQFKIFQNNGNYDSMILNTGPLMRLRAEEYNKIHKPGIFIIDIYTMTGKIVSSRIDINCENWQNVLTFEEEKIKQELQINSFIEMIKSRKKVLNFDDALRIFIQSEKPDTNVIKEIEKVRMEVK